jgi:hypothetical protein
VTPQALLTLDVALKLVRALALPLPRALETAQRLIAAREGGIELPGVASIHVVANTKTLADDLTLRLERAVEISPTPRRGRPRRK